MARLHICGCILQLSLSRLKTSTYKQDDLLFGSRYIVLHSYPVNMDNTNTGPIYAAVRTSDTETKDQPVSMSGRFSDIAISALVTTVPILILSGVLLALVFSLRVTQQPSIFSQIQQPTFNETGVYYVDISSTYLVFFASWSSSVVPMLATFLLTLASFPIATGVMEQSRVEASTRSLTPYQLALTLTFLSGGGYGAMWKWLKYLFVQRRTRERQVQALTQAAWIALVAQLLGYLITTFCYLEALLTRLDCW